MEDTIRDKNKYIHNKYTQQIHTNRRGGGETHPFLLPSCPQEVPSFLSSPIKIEREGAGFYDYPSHPLMNMNLNNDYDCFIRRSGQPWTRARAHHRQALEAFLSSQEEQPSQEGQPGHRISVPHTDGGEFVAFFRRVNSVVYQYRDEYEQTVEIMMSSGSSYAAFINRVVDYE